MAILRIFTALLVFCSFRIAACQDLSIDAMKADIELSFSSKSFVKLLKRQIGTPSAHLEVEDEYDEDQPISKYSYPNLETFTKAFYSMEQYTNSMIVPETVTCSASACEYELPHYTLHHATYLVGFSLNVKHACLQNIKISIYHA